MGVDTQLTLPSAVQVSDVAKAIALLLGKPKTWYDIKTKSNGDTPTASGWVEVEGITFNTSDNQPSCCTINIKDIPAVYGGGWWFFYHFEFVAGNRGMLGRSRAERIALHRGLAKVFGGKVDYNDCDSRDVNFRKTPPAWLDSREDKNFHLLQMALWNIVPITLDEIKRCEKWASYQKKAA